MDNELNRLIEQQHEDRRAYPQKQEHDPRRKDARRRPLRASVTRLVLEHNETVQPSRRVSVHSGIVAAERALLASAGRPDDERAFAALRAVDQLLTLAASGGREDVDHTNTDLLAVGHPLSTAPHAMTASALRNARAQWFAADPRLEEDLRPIVAAAYAAPHHTVDRVYAFTRLAATDGVPMDLALDTQSPIVASLSWMGNSSAAKSARARAQRRDRLKRFAFEGGLFKFNGIDAKTGRMQSIIGKVVGEPDNADTFELELVNHPQLGTGVFTIPANDAESIRARIGETPEQAAKRLAGTVPTAKEAARALTFDELLASKKEAPTGWKKNKDGSFSSDDGYRVDVVVNADGTREFTLSRTPKGGKKSVVGKGSDWYDVQNLAEKDSAAYETSEKARLDGKAPAAAPAAPAAPLKPKAAKVKKAVDAAKNKNKVAATDAERQQMVVDQLLADGWQKSSMGSGYSKRVDGIFVRVEVAPEGIFVPEGGSFTWHKDLAAAKADIAQARATELTSRIDELKQKLEHYDKDGKILEAALDGRGEDARALLEANADFRSDRKQAQDYPNSDSPAVKRFKNSPYNDLSYVGNAVAAGKDSVKAKPEARLDAPSERTSITLVKPGTLNPGDKIKLDNNKEYTVVSATGNGASVTLELRDANGATTTVERDKDLGTHLVEAAPQKAKLTLGERTQLPDWHPEHIPAQLKGGQTDSPTGGSTQLTALVQDVADRAGVSLPALDREVLDKIVGDDNLVPVAAGWTQSDTPITDLVTRALKGDREALGLLEATSNFIDDVIDDNGLQDPDLKEIANGLYELHQTVKTMNIAPQGKKPVADLNKPRFNDWKAPQGFYVIDTAQPYRPAGRTFEDSTDYTDDPEVLGNTFSSEQLQDALSMALMSGLPAADLPFDKGQEGVPVEALYEALDYQGFDVDKLVGDMYDYATNSSANYDALKAFNESTVGNVPMEVDRVEDITPQAADIKALNAQIASNAAAKVAADLIKKYHGEGVTNPKVQEIADFLKANDQHGAGRAFTKFLHFAESDDPQEREAFRGLLGLLHVSDGGNGLIDEKLHLAYTYHSENLDGNADHILKEFGTSQDLVRSKAAVAKGDEDPDSPDSIAGATYRMAAALAEENQDTLYRGVPMKVGSKALEQNTTVGGVVSWDLRPTSDTPEVADLFGYVFSNNNDSETVTFIVNAGDGFGVDMRTTSPHTGENEILGIGDYRIESVNRVTLEDGRINNVVQLVPVDRPMADDISRNFLSENAVVEMPQGRYTLETGPFWPEEGSENDPGQNPLELANAFSKPVLEEALFEAIASGDGYATLRSGSLGGDKSAELLRDALKAQGEPTDEIIRGIRDELAKEPASDDQVTDLAKDGGFEEHTLDTDVTDGTRVFGRTNWDGSVAETVVQRPDGTLFSVDDQGRNIEHGTNANDAFMPDKNYTLDSSAPKGPMSEIEKRQRLMIAYDRTGQAAYDLDASGRDDWSAEVQDALTAYENLRADMQDDNFSDPAGLQELIDAHIELRQAVYNDPKRTYDPEQADALVEALNSERDLLIQTRDMSNGSGKTEDKTLAELRDELGAPTAATSGWTDTPLNSSVNREQSKTDEQTGFVAYVSHVQTTGLGGKPYEKMAFSVYDDRGEQLAVVELPKGTSYEEAQKLASEQLAESAAKALEARAADPVGFTQNRVLNDWLSVSDAASEMWVAANETDTIDLLDGKAHDALWDLNRATDEFNAANPGLMDRLENGEASPEDAKLALDYIEERLANLEAYTYHDVLDRQAQLLRDSVAKMQVKGDKTLEELRSELGSPAGGLPEGANLDELVQVGPQTGSNKGGLYEAPDGRRYYVKTAKSQAHADSEVLASRLYNEAGIPAAKVQRGTMNGELVTFSEIVDGNSEDFYKKLTRDEAFRETFQDGFVVDAWLGNWDVTGLNMDNVVVDGSGNPVRIDTGGALEWRAQGQPKTSVSDGFTPEAEEIGTLLDPAVNPQSASAFEGMSEEAMATSAQHLLAIDEPTIDRIVDETWGATKSQDEIDKMKFNLKARREDLLKKTLGDPVEFDFLPAGAMTREVTADEFMAAVQSVFDPSDVAVSRSTNWTNPAYDKNETLGVDVYINDSLPEERKSEIARELNNMYDREHRYFEALDRAPEDELTQAGLLDKVILNGGGTISPMTGEEPQTGFVVAVQGHNVEIPAADFFDPEKGPQAIADWYEANEELFDNNDAYHIGLWYDKKNQEVVLDVTEVFTPDQRDAAVQAGKDRNQQAIWDLTNSEEISTGGTGDRAEQEAAPGDNSPGEPTEAPGVGEADSRGNPGVGQDDSQPSSDQGAAKQVAPALDVPTTQNADGVHVPTRPLTTNELRALSSGEATPPALPFAVWDTNMGDVHYYDTTGTRRWGQFGAAGMLVTRDNPQTGEPEFLLVQRADVLSTEPGSWTVPGGAHESKSDSSVPNYTAEKELREETGLILDDNGLRKEVKVQPAPDWGYTYTVAPTSNDWSLDGLGMDPVELQSAKWVSADEFKQMQADGQLHSAIDANTVDRLIEAGSTPFDESPIAVPAKPAKYKKDAAAAAAVTRAADAYNEPHVPDNLLDESKAAESAYDRIIDGRDKATESTRDGISAEDGAGWLHTIADDWANLADVIEQNGKTPEHVTAVADIREHAADLRKQADKLRGKSSDSTGNDLPAFVPSSVVAPKLPVDKNGTVINPYLPEDNATKAVNDRNTTVFIPNAPKDNLNGLDAPEAPSAPEAPAAPTVDDYLQEGKTIVTEELPDGVDPDMPDVEPSTKEIAPGDIVSMQRIKKTWPNHVVLDNGDVVVDSFEVTRDGKTYRREVVIKRNAETGNNETYTVYGREVDLTTGEVRTRSYKNRSHSDKALRNQVAKMRGNLNGKAADAHFKKSKPAADAPQPKVLRDISAPEVDAAITDAMNQAPARSDAENLDALIAIADMLKDTPENREAMAERMKDWVHYFGSGEAVRAVFDAVQAGDARKLGKPRKVTHLSQNGVQLTVGMRVSWTSPDGKKTRTGTVTRLENLASKGYGYTDYAYVRFDDAPKRRSPVHRVSDRLVALDGDGNPLASPDGADSAPSGSTPSADAVTTSETGSQDKPPETVSDVVDAIDQSGAAESRLQAVVAALTLDEHPSNDFFGDTYAPATASSVEELQADLVAGTANTYKPQSIEHAQEYLKPEPTGSGVVRVHVVAKTATVADLQTLTMRSDGEAPDFGDYEFEHIGVTDGGEPRIGDVLKINDTWIQVVGRKNEAFSSYFFVRGLGADSWKTSMLHGHEFGNGTYVDRYRPTDATMSGAGESSYVRSAYDPSDLSSLTPVEAGKRVTFEHPETVLQLAALADGSDPDFAEKMSKGLYWNIQNNETMLETMREYYPQDSGASGSTHRIAPLTVVTRIDGSVGVVTRIKEADYKNTPMREAPPTPATVTWLSGPAKGMVETTSTAHLMSTGRVMPPRIANRLNVPIQDASNTFLMLMHAKDAEVQAKKDAEEGIAKKQRQDAELRQWMLENSAEEGPGAAITADGGPADWSASPVDGISSVEAALTSVQSDPEKNGRIGVPTLVDAGDIEDGQVIMYTVTNDKNRSDTGDAVVPRTTKARFTLTSWAGNALVEDLLSRFGSDADVTDAGDTGLSVGRYDATLMDGTPGLTPSLVTNGGSVWSLSEVDANGEGRTFRVTLRDADGQDIGYATVHRANRDASTPTFVFNDVEYHGTQAKSPLSFHNKVELTLYGDATPEQLEQAMRQAGVTDPRPANPEALRVIKENKLIALLNGKANGAVNYAGPERAKNLDEIEATWGITADDVEIDAPENSGHVRFRGTREFGERMAEYTGVRTLVHGTGGFYDDYYGESAGKKIARLLDGGALMATAERRSIGINDGGYSSQADVLRQGGNYMFTRVVTDTTDEYLYQQQNSGGGVNFVYDAAEAFRRLDWFFNSHDQFGSRFDNSPPDHLKEKVQNNNGLGGAELMIKHTLDMSALVGMGMLSDTRKEVIEWFEINRGGKLPDGRLARDVFALRPKGTA